MKPNPVGWFEIYVQDMDRARTFYEAMLQTSLEHLPTPATETGDACEGDLEMWAFPMSENDYGAPGALVKMDEVPSGAGGTMVYFTCKDCAVEARRAADNGGSIFRDRMSIGEYGFIAIVYDTEGNMLGLHSQA